MNIPFITRYRARKAATKRLDELCKNARFNRAKNRSDAGVKAAQTRQHFDSSTDPVVMEVRHG